VAYYCGTSPVGSNTTTEQSGKYAKLDFARYMDIPPGVSSLTPMVSSPMVSSFVDVSTRPSLENSSSVS